MGRLIPERAPGQSDDEYRAVLVEYREHQRRALRDALRWLAWVAVAVALAWLATE